MRSLYEFVVSSGSRSDILVEDFLVPIHSKQRNNSLIYLNRYFSYLFKVAFTSIKSRKITIAMQFITTSIYWLYNPVYFVEFNVEQI